MENMLIRIKQLFGIGEYELREINPHEGGRNLVYICEKDEKPAFVVRVSLTGDRSLEEYQAEVDFVHYLAKRGASVADVIPSITGNLVEGVTCEGVSGFVSLFAYAEGMLISDNGYQYREGAPLSEYFFNTGKTLGKIHQLSFDLANLWTHGVGWCQFEEEKKEREAFMKDYFHTIMEGYRTETEISDESLANLPLFIDMVLIENIVDECECCKREGKELDYEDIEDAAECLINKVPFAGFC